MRIIAGMKKPTYQQVLIALCLRDKKLVKADGGINHNELARKIEANQPTVSRHLNGEVDHPSGKMGEKIRTYFGVTLDQLVGNEPVPGLFPAGQYAYPKKPAMGAQPHSKDILLAELGRMSEEELEDFIRALPSALSLQARDAMVDAALEHLSEYLSRKKK